MKTVTYNQVLFAAAEAAGRTRDKVPPSEAVMLQQFLAVGLQEIWNRANWPELIPDFLQVTPSGRLVTKNEGAPQGNFTGAVSTNGDALATFTSDTAHGLITGQSVTISGGAALGDAFFDGTYAVTVTGTNTFTYVIVAQNSAFLIGSPNMAVIYNKLEIGDVLTVATLNPRTTTRARLIDFSEMDNQVWLSEACSPVWLEYMQPAPDLMTIAANVLPTYALPAKFMNYLSLRGAGWLLKADSQEAGALSCWNAAEMAMKAQVDRLPPEPWWRRPRLRK